MHKRIGANKMKKHREARSAATLRRKGRSYVSIGVTVLLTLFVCGGVIGGAVRLWAWLENTPKLLVRSIEIRGNIRTNQEEIRRLSQLRVGMHMLGIRPAQAERAIMTIGWIRQAHVSRRFPGKVKVDVEEREPIALVNVGRIYYIDKEGVELPLFPATYTDLPVISGVGDSTCNRISRASLKRIVALLGAADDINPSLMKQVSQIDFSNGSTVRIKLENNPLLIEIDDRNYGVQLRRFQELMEVFKNNPEGMPQSINLCYANLAFAKW